MGAEALELRHELGHHLAGLAEILGLDVLKRGIGEIRDLLLPRCAVLHNGGGIVQIDLLGEAVDRLLLLGSEYGLLHRLLNRVAHAGLGHKLHLGGGDFIGGKGKCDLLFHVGTSFRYMIQMVFTW